VTPGTRQDRLCPDRPGTGARTSRGACHLSERHNQVYRETEVQRHRRSGHDEPDQDHDHVPNEGGQKFSLYALQLLALFLRRVEVLAPGIRVHSGRREANCQQCQPVDRDGDAFVGPDVQGVDDEPGRERQERHHEQADQVETIK